MQCYTLHSKDLPRQRERIDKVVKYPSTEKLKPWYQTRCKRPCFHDVYLHAFKEPNVTIVDTGGKDVDIVCEQGIVMGDTGDQLGVLIFSTGFRSLFIGSPAGRANASVIGRSSRSLNQKWVEGG